MSEHTAVFSEKHGSSTSVDYSSVFMPYIKSFTTDDFFRSGLVRKAYVMNDRNEIYFLLRDRSLDSERKFMQHALNIWPSLLDPVYPIILDHEMDENQCNAKVFDFSGYN